MYFFFRALPFLVSSHLHLFSLSPFSFLLTFTSFPPFFAPFSPLRPLLLAYCSFSQCYYSTSRARTEIN